MRKAYPTQLVQFAILQLRIVQRSALSEQPAEFDPFGQHFPNIMGWLYDNELNYIVSTLEEGKRQGLFWDDAIDFLVDTFFARMERLMPEPIQREPFGVFCECVPDAIAGRNTPANFTYKTKDEIMQHPAVVRWQKTPGFHRFSLSASPMIGSGLLMAEYDNGAMAYAVGSIGGNVDLELPKYERPATKYVPR